MTTYTLSGGCFWCLDAVFRKLKGVERSLCGYTGGAAEDATYQTVSTGTTGHVETIQVSFDESILPPDTLLDIFFTLHDPTTMNRQGADVGPQYASVMWFRDEHEETEFRAARDRAALVWQAPIVTRIEPLDQFYPAESDHQDYADSNPAAPYCMVVIDPKITKVRSKFAAYFREKED